MAGFGFVKIPRVQLSDLDLALQQVRRLPTTAREAGVLFRSGLANPTRPDEAAYSLLAMRRWGMVAGRDQDRGAARPGRRRADRRPRAS